MKKKQVKLIILALFIAILGVIGVSYAVWQLTKTQEGTNVITSGCFKITFTGQNDILLNNAYPISDEEGRALTPYTFTIKNECATSANYVINLETVSAGEKILSEEYLKASLQQSETNLFLDTLTAKNENTEKVIPEARKAYKLYQGVLNANEEVSYDLRLWMDNDTPTIDEVMNASYEGKITVSSSYSPAKVDLPIIQAFTVRGEDDEETVSKFRIYDSEIKKVVFENRLHEIEGAIASYDVSAQADTNDTGKVMAYVIENEDHSKTVYIQGNGGVKANANSSYLFESFLNLETIEGLEYFDTSNVTNMSHMFDNCQKLTSLDLSHFDTSNVTDMSYMFLGNEGLTSLNISNFNTGKVTNMNGMFSGNWQLVHLNLGEFDTANVTTMQDIFFSCANLVTTITLRNPELKFEDLVGEYATLEGSMVTINYTNETESLVDQIVGAKLASSNIVKGALVQ